MGDLGNILFHYSHNLVRPITDVQGARARVEARIRWFHGLVEHDLVALSVDDPGRLLRLGKPREYGESHGDTEIKKRCQPGEIGSDIVNDKGNAGLGVRSGFKGVGGLGFGKRIEPEEAS